MLVTATSLSRPWLVTLSCLCSCFNFLFWWISTNISTLLPDKTTLLEYKTKLTLLKKTTKSEMNQDKVSFPTPLLVWPTSITTLLLVLLALSNLIISPTITTTSDVSMHLPSFIVDNPDVKESDLKLNSLTIQSTLSLIQVEDPKIKDRYKTFWSSITTILCKNLRWNLQLDGYNRWKHSWKHIQYEHKISPLHCSQHYSEFL